MKKLIFLEIVLFFSFNLNLLIFFKHYSNLLILTWILTILFYVGAFLNLKDVRIFLSKQIRLSYKTFLLLLILLFPIFIRILFINSERTHRDEYLLGYFAIHYNFAKDNFFAPFPAETEWIAQYPSVYFIVQKAFFAVFGETFLSVKLSHLPYVLLITVGLYLIVKTLFDKKMAIISVILYAFFAPAMYFETLAIHNYAPIGVFLLTFYLLLSNYQKEGHVKAALAGILCGFCYLIHSAAFLAFPFMIIFYLYEVFRTTQKMGVVKKAIVSFFGVLIVVLPFLNYSLISKNFYFVGRINQVSLLNGTWSPFRENIIKGISPINVVVGNFFEALKSFYIDGVGGDQGYNFGHLALLNKIDLILFLTGAVLGFYLILKKRNLFWVYVLIFINFFAGVVMTMPPPSYQRLIIVFPFLVIIISLPCYFILKIKNHYFKSIIICFIISIFAFNNVKYFFKSLKQDDYDNIRLAKYVEKQFPKRKVYIAAFPTFELEKVFYFSSKSNVRNARLEYHATFLSNFNTKEKYVYVILFPGDFNKKFQAKDPNGRIIKFSNNYSLFVN